MNTGLWLCPGISQYICGAGTSAGNCARLSVPNPEGSGYSDSESDGEENSDVLDSSSMSWKQPQKTCSEVDNFIY